MSDASSPPARWFGTDGIRAIAGEGPLTPASVLLIGRALAQHARSRAAGADPRILIAMDPRPSGPGLVAQLAGGMAHEGAHVLEAGILPTPALAWLTAEGGFDLGVMVSASHNAEPYNGIKPFLSSGRKLSEADELSIELALASLESAGEPSSPPRDMKARFRYLDATTAWLAKDGDLSGLHLVVDLSGGAATTTAPFILDALGARTTILHGAGEGVINENCGSQHPESMLAALAETKADAGIAFDGDADRVLIATPGGQMLDGDDMLSILAEDAKERGGLPGGAVVSTVMSNLGLEERMQSLVGRLERTPVGDRHVAERMVEVGSHFGGEPSGHVVLLRDDLPGEAVPIGDALVAAVRVLQAARRLGTDLDALRARRPRYPQTLVGVRVTEKRPIEEWPELRDEIAAQEEALAGVGRLIVRYSGTEPLLRIMAEGKQAEAVDAAVEAIRAVAAAG